MRARRDLAVHAEQRPRVVGTERLVSRVADERATRSPTVAPAGNSRSMSSASSGRVGLVEDFGPLERIAGAHAQRSAQSAAELRPRAAPLEIEAGARGLLGEAGREEVGVAEQLRLPVCAEHAVFVEVGRRLRRRRRVSTGSPRRSQADAREQVDRLGCARTGCAGRSRRNRAARTRIARSVPRRTDVRTRRRPTSTPPP